MAGLQITTKKHPDDIVAISLKGIIDGYSYTQLEEVLNRLVEEHTYKIVVDLSQVTYMCSAGAGIFISLFSVVQENKGNIILVNPKPAVRDLFELLGITGLFSITNDQPSALAEFT